MSSDLRESGTIGVGTVGRVNMSQKQLHSSPFVKLIAPGGYQCDSDYARRLPILLILLTWVGVAIFDAAFVLAPDFQYRWWCVAAVTIVGLMAFLEQRIVIDANSRSVIHLTKVLNWTVRTMRHEIIDGDHLQIFVRNVSEPMLFHELHVVRGRRRFWIAAFNAKGNTEVPEYVQYAQAVSELLRIEYRGYAKSPKFYLT